MKVWLIYIAAFCQFFSQFAEAEIVTGHAKFDAKISTNECINRSKLARQELFDDDFGEGILDENYSYLNDDVSITVVCLEEKEMVMIFVATQGKNPIYYLRCFEKYIKDKSEIKKLQGHPS